MNITTKAQYEFNNNSDLGQQIKIIKKFEKIIKDSAQDSGYNDYKVVQCSDDSLYVNITFAVQTINPCNDYNKVNEYTFQFCSDTKTLVLQHESYEDFRDNNDDERGHRIYDLPCNTILNHINSLTVRNLYDAIALVELFRSSIIQLRAIINN